MIIRRCYQALDNGRQVHYLRAGSGAPVLLLHPSPLSGEFLRPLIDYLGSGFDVIAMDTPGYGHSDALADPTDNLAPYVQVIGEFLQKLELAPVVVYGNATGAQLAIESAKAHVKLICGLVIENAACFSDEERATLLTDYFPDLSPRSDGSHLTLAWRIAQQLYQFFPWYDTSEDARFSAVEPHLQLVQATALSYLQAGPDYARAYRAAFDNEKSQQLAAVTQSVTVLLWQDSMLLEYSRRLQAADMPPGIQFIDVAAGIDARYGAIRQALTQTLESL